MLQKYRRSVGEIWTRPADYARFSVYCEYQNAKTEKRNSQNRTIENWKGATVVVTIMYILIANKKRSLISLCLISFYVPSLCSSCSLAIYYTNDSRDHLLGPGRNVVSRLDLQWGKVDNLDSVFSKRSEWVAVGRLPLGNWVDRRWDSDSLGGRRLNELHSTFLLEAQGTEGSQGSTEVHCYDINYWSW